VGGSTSDTREWNEELKEGDTLELEVSLESGFHAAGSVSRMDTADDIAVLETETEGETITEEFEVPASVEYLIFLSTGGDDNPEASLTLRKV
jgi:hypothetical protein